MDGLSSPGPDDIEIWTPHIRAYVIEPACSLLGKPAEERLECLFAPFGTNPKKPFTSSINLIHESQVFVALLPRDLIDAYGSDVTQIPIFQAPINRHLHAFVDGMPCDRECPCNVSEVHSFCLSRQKPGETASGRRLSLRPRHHLNSRATGFAIDSPHGVDEEHDNAPERYKLKQSCGKGVVG